MNQPLLGARIVEGTIVYFVSAPSQALAQHKSLVEQLFKQNLDLVTGANVTVRACRDYQSVDKWVVLEDVAPSNSNLGIFYTKWTPESPVPLEHDHTGAMRYKVLDFASSEAEAVAVVNQLKRERDEQ